MPKGQLSATSPDWNCQWGPSGARIAIPVPCPSIDASQKRDLSTHTMHFKWHHRNLSKNDSESLETNHEWRHAFIINTKKLKCPKIPKFLSGNPDGRWSVQLFLPGPWRFLLAPPCPSGPHPGDGAGCHCQTGLPMVRTTTRVFICANSPCSSHTASSIAILLHDTDCGIKALVLPNSKTPLNMLKCLGTELLVWQYGVLLHFVVSEATRNASSGTLNLSDSHLTAVCEPVLC